MDSRFFRKQFLLTDSDQSAKMAGTDWSTWSIGRYRLFTHPLLKTVACEGKEWSTILMGFAVHCYLPDIDEKDIVEKLNSLQGRPLLDELDKLGGNFVVLRHDKDRISVYNDPATAQKVFYFKRGKEIFVGSDPKLIGEFTNLEEDSSPEAREYYTSSFFKKNERWVGNLTKYKDVYQLLPNHRLLLPKMRVERFFPREKREEIELGTAAKQVAELLRNLARGFARKNKLAIALTAGWDSRILMAATRDYANDIYYFTFDKGLGNEFDVIIAQKLCDIAGQEHHLIERQLTDEHTRLHQGSFALKKMQSVPHGETSSGYEYNHLKGTVSEICKNYYGGIEVTNKYRYAGLAHFPMVTYCLDHFDSWLKEHRNFINSMGYRINDFAHWEQDICNFAGTGAHHNNQFYFVSSLFNCRECIRLSLATHHRYRSSYRHRLYYKVIQILWKELLVEPFNPSRKVKWITSLDRLGLYKWYQYGAYLKKCFSKTS